MARGELADLSAFLAVARERSFTKAAAKLGVSQSALSHTIRRLEANLGVRLLERTTRSVSPTQAGERLLASIGPRLDEVEAELASLSDLRDVPAGTIRITTSAQAATTILLPKLAPLLRDHPAIELVIDTDASLTDIVAARYDAGVRLGEQVARGMIAIPIGPSMRMATVATPAYFAAHPPPKRPQDLTAHRCINLRLPGGMYVWEFEKNGRELNVRVEGQLVVNTSDEMVCAARAGIGIAHVLEGKAERDIADRRLVRVLEDWCPPFAGFHLYFPSRRQMSPAFALIVEALRVKRR